MKKAVKSILDKIIFLFTCKGETAEKFVNEGLCDFSGCGRDKYGK